MYNTPREVVKCGILKEVSAPCEWNWFCKLICGIYVVEHRLVKLIVPFAFRSVTYINVFDCSRYGENIILEATFICSRFNLYIANYCGP